MGNQSLSANFSSKCRESKSVSLKKIGIHEKSKKINEKWKWISETGQSALLKAELANYIEMLLKCY